MRRVVEPFMEVQKMQLVENKSKEELIMDEVAENIIRKSTERSHVTEQTHVSKQQKQLVDQSHHSVGGTVKVVIVSMIILVALLFNFEFTSGTLGT